MAKPIVILGVFVADTAYHAKRQPRMGETLLGSRFTLGPGGKGSNQAVACGKLGADVSFITRLGKDPFADMAMKAWTDAGVKPAITVTPESYTGAAYIFLEEGTGNNAIQNYTVYGRVPAQPVGAAGAYADTITVTLTY